MRNFLVHGMLAFMLVLALDGYTKQWAEETLILHQPVPVMGQELRLTLGYNSGAAFGIFPNGGLWLALASGVLMVTVVVWLLYTIRNRTDASVFVWPAGLLLGGGVGNLLDRIADGRVTDFVDIGLEAMRWPTFNVADACIFVAVTAFLLTSTKKSEAV